jgi:hypothetical protein
LKLRDAKILFDRVRKNAANIFPRDHIFRDHPERLFTPDEIRSLVQSAGRLTDNNKMPTAQGGSFLWLCKDEADRRCELAIRFEMVAPNEIIVVVHAFREV